VQLPSRRPIRLVELKPETKNRNNDLLFFSDRNSASCSYVGGEHVSVATAASIYGPYTDDRRHPAGTCLGVGYFCVWTLDEEKIAVKLTMVQKEQEEV
jgi:hypothetical protein